jgi:hypothetical protein
MTSQWSGRNPQLGLDPPDIDYQVDSINPHIMRQENIFPFSKHFYQLHQLQLVLTIIMHISKQPCPCNPRKSHFNSELKSTSVNNSSQKTSHGTSQHGFSNLKLEKHIMVAEPPCFILHSPLFIVIFVVF